MIERAFVWIDGPAGVGKTTLVERVIASSHEPALAVRVVAAGSKRQVGRVRQTPETARFDAAGAVSSVVYRRAPDDDPDAFWDCGVTESFARAVVLEGALADFVRPDLVVHVMRPLPEGRSLLVRGAPGPRRVDRQRAALLEQFLLGEDPARPVHRGFERLLPSLGLTPSARGSGWSLCAEHADLPSAGLVVINVHDDAERPAAARLEAEVRRLRDDAEVKRDVLGAMGSKRQPTVVVANLADPKDAGLKKAVTRVRRTISRAAGA